LIDDDSRYRVRSIGLVLECIDHLFAPPRLSRRQLEYCSTSTIILITGAATTVESSSIQISRCVGNDTAFGIRTITVAAKFIKPFEVTGKRVNLLDAIGRLADEGVVTVTGVSHSPKDPLTLTLSRKELPLYYMSKGDIQRATEIAAAEGVSIFGLSEPRGNITEQEKYV
jgi:hypothetical protein